jgi:hypothetical protein
VSERDRERERERKRKRERERERERERGADTPVKQETTERSDNIHRVKDCLNTRCSFSPIGGKILSQIERERLEKKMKTGKEIERCEIEWGNRLVK